MPQQRMETKAETSSREENSPVEQSKQQHSGDGEAVRMQGMASHGDRFRGRPGLIPTALKFPGLQGLCVGGLDTTSYLPVNMTPPALMVLASSAGAECSQSPLHVQGQRPFSNSQNHMDKEPNSPLHVPYTSSSSFPLRPVFPHSEGAYSTSLSGHLMPVPGTGSLGTHSSNLDRHLAFLNPTAASGAFRPLGAVHPDERNGFHGSAFVPAKCLKLEHQSPGSAASSRTGELQHSIASHFHHNNKPGGFLSPPTSTSSRASSSSGLTGAGSPIPVKEEYITDKDSSATPTPDHSDRLTETPASEGENSLDRCTPDEGRTLRAKKKSIFDGQTPCCPVCGVSIRPSELSSHFEQEVERLTKIGKSIKRPSREGTPQNRLQLSSASAKKKDGSDKGTPDARWETYQRVRSNRHNRLNVVTPVDLARACQGKPKRRPLEGTVCPVCSDQLSGTPEELNDHVLRCLKRRENGGSEDEPVDVEGDDTYEEYEWAGQTRIRATSLLQGGFSASGFQTSRGRSDEDEDQDLNVDGDDTATYGQPQYSEVDVIPCTSDEPKEAKEQQEIRKALLASESPHLQSMVSESQKTRREESGTPSATEEASTTAPADSSGEGLCEDQSTKQVIASLKDRIKELEEQHKSVERMKCLICMESFTNPVVSVSCWHVHCEECWLRTLGAKKLCPQCNMITSPTDLRRIYL